MNRLLSIVLICLLFACKNKSDANISAHPINQKDSLLRILTYGLPDLERTTVDAEIAKQYYFCYYPVAGCVVSKELVDSINQENAKVYNVLVKKYGADWKQEYRRKTDSLRKLLEQVNEIVHNALLVQKISHQRTGGLYYHVSPADTANFFNVQAFSSDSNNLAYTFRVNLQNHRIDLVK